MGQASLPASSRGISAPCFRARQLSVRARRGERAAGCRPNWQAGSLPHGIGGESAQSRRDDRKSPGTSVPGLFSAKGAGLYQPGAPSQEARHFPFER